MPTKTDLSGLKCLVVDNNKHERALLNTALRAMDIHNVVMAADAESGLEILRTRHVDLIIVDMELTEISGVDFTRLVRRGNLAPRPEIPIIMVAGTREKRAVIQAVQAGVHAFVVKPLTIAMLREKITRTAFNSRPLTRNTEVANRTGHAVNQ